MTNIWENLEIKKQDSDKDLIKSADAKIYPGLALTKTEKLAMCKYKIEGVND